MAKRAFNRMKNEMATYVQKYSMARSFFPPPRNSGSSMGEYMPTHICRTASKARAKDEKRSISWPKMRHPRKA